MFVDFAPFPILLLRWSSLSVIQINNKYLHFAYFKFYPFFIWCFVILATNLSYTIHISVVKDLDEFAKNVSILAITLYISFKWISFKGNINRIFDFIGELSSKSFEPQDEVEIALYDASKLFAKKVVFAVIFVVSCSSLATPFIISDSQAYPYWYPFHLNEKLDDLRVSIPLFGHQCICASIFAIITLGANLFLFSLMVFHNYQIKLLAHRLQKFVCPKSGKSHQGQEKDYDNLTSLLKLHTKIKNNVSKFHELFGITLFYEIFQAVGVLSLSSIILILTGDFMSNVLVFVLKAIYVIYQCVEIAFFCYLGNEIYYSSLDLPVSIYFSNFTETNIRTRKIIPISMHAISKPIALEPQAFFTFEMNMKLFLSIVRSTYSYVIVMLKMA